MLVFAAVRGSRPDSVNDLFVVRPDGRGLRQLTIARSPAAWYDENDPAWSPDGRRIAYSRGDPLINAGAFVKDMSAVIAVTDASGKNPKRVTKPNLVTGDVLDGSPSWSPDGRSIAFTRQYTQYLERPGIYVVGVNGRGLRRVATRTAIAVDWSPDGRSLAFVAGGFETEAPGRVGIIDLATGAISEFRSPHADDVSWAPSGKMLAVTSIGALFDSRDAIARSADAGIAIVRPTGKAVRRILTGCRTAGVTWSPDGRHLAYGAYGGACSKRPGIYVVATDGRTQANRGQRPIARRRPR